MRTPPSARRTPRRLAPAGGVLLLLALVLPVLLLIGAPARAGAGGPRPQTATELLDQGERLYQVGCISCHGADGRGVENRGPTLAEAGPAATDFYLSTGRMPAASGAGQPRRKEPVYDEAERAALVAYVSTLGEGPPIPDVDPAQGDLSLGQQLYTANCAACHNSAGSGGALGQAIYAPALQPATALQVAEAIRVGPGAMPGFSPQQLDQHELDSVVRYVTQLQDPVDRGGLPLGRVGPVPEGMVAWIVGLGVLVVALRWIGTNDTRWADLGQARERLAEAGDGGVAEPELSSREVDEAERAEAEEREERP